MTTAQVIVSPRAAVIITYTIRVVVVVVVVVVLDGVGDAMAFVWLSRGLFLAAFDVVGRVSSSSLANLIVFVEDFLFRLSNFTVFPLKCAALFL